jgi:hypothetical protein
MAEKMPGMPKADIISRNLWDVYAAFIDSESYKKYHLALETNNIERFEDFFPQNIPGSISACSLQRKAYQFILRILRKD